MKHIVRVLVVVAAGLAIGLPSAEGNATAWCVQRPSANGSCEPINPNL